MSPDEAREIAIQKLRKTAEHIGWGARHGEAHPGPMELARWESEILEAAAVLEAQGGDATACRTLPDSELPMRRLPVAREASTAPAHCPGCCFKFPLGTDDCPGIEAQANVEEKKAAPLARLVNLGGGRFVTPDLVIHKVMDEMKTLQFPERALASTYERWYDMLRALVEAEKENAT